MMQILKHANAVQITMYNILKVITSALNVIQLILIVKDVMNKMELLFALLANLLIHGII